MHFFHLLFYFITLAQVSEKSHFAFFKKTADRDYFFSVGCVF